MNFIKLLVVSGEELLGVVTMDANILLYAVADLDRAPIQLNNYSAAHEDNSTWSLDASGDWVVAGSNAWTISCWNLATGENRRSQVHSHNIPCVTCVAGTSLVLTASIDSSCRVSTLEGLELAQAAPSHAWGWFVTSIPRQSINLSARSFPGQFEYITTCVDQVRDASLLMKRRGAPAAENQLQECGLLLYATGRGLYLIDPAVQSQRRMHVLCEYVPTVASLIGGNGRISLVEYVPEWGVCIFASQFKQFLCVVQLTKTPVEAAQQFVYFISPVTDIRVSGRVLGLAVNNCVDQSNTVWVYVLTDNAEVVGFSLSKRDELLALVL